MLPSLSAHLICGVIVAAIVIDTAESIRCYHCNSANNSACFDIKAFSRFQDIVPLVNCETAVPRLGSATKFFCRKMVQTILNPGRDSELRVTRGCGWVPHHRECYKADNDDHLETVCQCSTDRCNASHRMAESAILLSLVTGVCLWFAGATARS